MQGCDIYYAGETLSQTARIAIAHRSTEFRVTIGGRAFLLRLIDLTIGHTKLHYHIRVTEDVRKDPAVWKTFFDGYNCRFFFHDEQWLSSDRIRLFTGELGNGAICGTHPFSGEWPDKWKSLFIATLKLFPIMISPRILAPIGEQKDSLHVGQYGGGRHHQ